MQRVGSVNCSLHFSFVVSKLVSDGRELGCSFKLTRFANCVFSVVLLCVRHGGAGWYLLLELSNRIVLVYHSSAIAVGSAVLFFPYSVYVLRYSEGFDNRTVHGLRCDGFLVTAYDLGVGAVYNRVLFCDALRQPELNDMFATGFSAASSKLALSNIMFSNIKSYKLTSACNLRALASVRQLNRDLVYVDSLWCVYRDSFCLLRWFLSTRNIAVGNVYDAFLFLSSVYGVFFHINYANARLRNSVLNERLFLSGYVNLDNKLVLSSNERLFSVIGVLNIDWLREECADYSAAFVISSNARFNVSLIRRALGLFVLDGSAFRCSKLRTLSLGIRHLFLNSAVAGASNCFCCGVLYSSVKLLQLTGIVAVSVGAIMFLRLPVWRLDLMSSIDSLQCWRASFGRARCLNKAKSNCKPRAPSVALAKAYFNVLMIVRRYLNGFGFREFKTDCFLYKQHVRLFKALSFVSLYTVNSGLFIRCSAVPNLAAQYFKHSSTACGVYETGKLTINCKAFDFVCVVGDSQIFSHLFCSVYYTFFRTLPLIVKSSGDDWQVFDLSLSAVCACGKLSCLALRFYGFVKSVFYFECRNDSSLRLAQTLAVYVFNSIYFVVEVGSALGLHNFASKLQRYNSMLCSVRLQPSNCSVSLGLAILSLKSFVPSFGFFCNLCLVLENFIQSNDSKLVWRC
ncbi:Phenylalanine--tRNA ligase beta subunit [Candidatus Hodgkinia cicadicola]|nr:Phenylalanine--tRNA ligase beta subunit [Candidatus Hodgkinia cicadicola]